MKYVFTFWLIRNQFFKWLWSSSAFLKMCEGKVDYFQRRTVYQLFVWLQSDFIYSKENKQMQTRKKKSYPRTFPPVLGAPIYKSATALRIKNCCRLCHGSRNQMNINKYLTSTWDLLQNTGENRECFITGTSWGHFPWRSSIWVQMWSKLWDKVAWKAQQSYIDWDKN